MVNSGELSFPIKSWFQTHSDKSLVIKRYLLSFSIVLFLVVGCGKHPLEPGTEQLKLDYPDNGEVLTRTEVQFGWFTYSGARCYKIQIFQGADGDSLLLEHETTYSSYIYSVPLSSGEYSWRVWATTDGENYTIHSPLWSFSLNLAPFSIGQIVPLTASPRDILLKDNYLYVACERAGVSILSIQDSLTLEKIVPTQDKALALATYQDYLFVADYRGDLLLYDIADRTNPVFLNSQFVRRAMDVEVSFLRDTLFIVVADEDNGITVFHLEEGNFMVQLGEPVYTGAYCKSVEIQDSLIFASADELGLKVYNWSNPMELLPVDSIDLPGELEDIFIADSRLYLGLGLAGINIFHIAFPLSNYLLWSYNPDIGNAIQLDRSSLYLTAAMGSEGCFIFREDGGTYHLAQQIDSPYCYSVKQFRGGFLIGDRDWGLVYLQDTD